MKEGGSHNGPEGKIILVGTGEERPTRGELKEELAKQIARAEAERRENMTVSEKLDEALSKLREILSDLPTDSREHARVEHTLRSVEGALERLGKDGAPEGAYAVNVEEYEGNPEKPYVQYEGVPVDELIDILRNTVRDLNKDLPTKEAMLALKKKKEDLWEQYRLAHDMSLQEDGKFKHTIYSEWEQAKKAYEEAERLRDIGYIGKAKELEDLANDLYKNSKGYFEAHYTKAHGESAEVWTEDERNKQDLRTRHEAKLISLDYRATGTEEGDYEAATEVLKYRRELGLADKEVEPLPVPLPQEPEPAPPEPVPVPPTPEPIPVPPEPIPKVIPEPIPVPPIPEPIPAPPHKQEKAKRIAIVDAQAQVELMARTRAAELLNQKLNTGSWLKKKWTHMWEEGYRQQFISEERKKILGQENRPGFIRRGMFGAKSFDATGVKNLFAGTGAEGENNAELGSLATRFAEDLQRISEGETKQQLEDQEFNKRINDLVYEFASGALSEAEFDLKKCTLVDDISQKYPDVFAQGGLTADNILEAARDFRKIHEHSGALSRLDVNLEVDLGLARQAIKTEANLTWIDKVISATQRYTGPGTSAEAIGFGVAIGSYFARKPVYWLGGAAGIGGLMGAMRRNVELKRDLEMHRAERAMGAAEPTAGETRRENAERFVYEMRPSSEVVVEVATLTDAFRASPTADTARALTAALADAEARHSLSESRQRDLISFSGATSLERGRLDFMRTLAEAKVALGNNGFSSDILATAEYTSALEHLGGDMDKIDTRERAYRWSENCKAAVKGAVGGLIVGGITQEALAYAGDHVDALHWLRPGGKATSAENLYHYLKGDYPTTPTGAGMTEVFGVASAGGVIEVDGTTELIPDHTTGLMALVDKTDHSQILARVSIDATGHVTPIAGSYDPNLIHCSERTVVTGTKSLGEWIDSVRGKFGHNVAHDVWHTGGYLDNDTRLPKVEFNELRLFMNYDHDGNLAINANKLQEYMQNAAGEQVQGSKHGGHVLDVAGEFAKGAVKIGLAPDASRPTEVLELVYEPGSHRFVAENGTDIMHFFGADAKGQPVLKGNGVLGIVHQLGARADGSKTVEWVNAIRGNGQPVETAPDTHIVTEIGRSNYVQWWGPWIWSFGRKPLEERGKNGNESGGDKKEGLVDTEGKYLDFKPEFFEDTGEEKKKEVEGLRVIKTSVDTRGQKIPSDRKDWEKEYPDTFPFANERQMAEYLFKLGNFSMVPRDAKKYVSLRPEERVNFIESCIKRDREMLEIGEGRGIDKEKMQEIVETVLLHTDKVLGKYGESGRSLLPAKEKVHVVGAIEYQAQSRMAGRGSLGMCFLESGEIFVNCDLLRIELYRSGSPDINVIISQLKRTIAHEVTHGSVASNYWMFNPDSADVLSVSRRSGLKFIRRQAIRGQDIRISPQQLIIERGRALNEAVTEALAEEATNSIYAAEGVQTPQALLEPYSAEREVLMMLEKQFEIPFEVFAKATVSRKSLRELAERLNGKTTNEQTRTEDGNVDIKIARPHFMSLFMSIMDYELHRGRQDYKVTKALIGGTKGIVITKDMKSGFAAPLLDRDGNIKQELIDRYGLIDEEQALKVPLAA